MNLHLRGGVESVPGDLGGPDVVTVVHTDGVYLFFVTFDAMRGTDVVSENPSLGGVVVTCKGVSGSTRQE